MGRRGLKQVDIVNAAATRGVHLGKSHISQYVSGKTTPRPDIMGFLAQELQVDEQWLAGEEANAAPSGSPVSSGSPVPSSSSAPSESAPELAAEPAPTSSPSVSSRVSAPV
ncbi:helix-turn-helix domain-containing protein, partial [Bifidobacterium vespertilionis]|nr:helix-turn-helix domain-containing protein [Bifidobacterium vespertilionis]